MGWDPEGNPWVPGCVDLTKESWSKFSWESVLTRADRTLTDSRLPIWLSWLLISELQRSTYSCLPPPTPTPPHPSTGVVDVWLVCLALMSVLRTQWVSMLMWQALYWLSRTFTIPPHLLFSQQSFVSKPQTGILLPLPPEWVLFLLLDEVTGKN